VDWFVRTLYRTVVNTAGERTSLANDPAPPSRRRVPWWAMVCLLGLLICFAVDEPLYRFLHEHYNHRTRPVPNWLTIPTRVLRAAEAWGEHFYIVAIGLAMWQLDRGRRSRVLVLILSASIVTLAIEGTKRVTGRQRPEVSLGKTRFDGPAAWSKGGDTQSFPSGHTGAAAAYSGTLATFYPPVRPIVMALVVGCAANRIWKERHFLSDCWLALWFGWWFAATLPGLRPLQPALARFDRWAAPRVAFVHES
jgi:membrane-associated phospholipid phosphatase